MLTVRRSTGLFQSGAALVLFLLSAGCADLDRVVCLSDDCKEFHPPTNGMVSVEQAQRFRQAETERAARLTQEISRLKADLETAEAALVEAESGLAGTHTRADVVSSLATTRIQIVRAESRAPWRAAEIADARLKLVEAERQLEEGGFGAALFFAYRARRVADSVLEEAKLVARDGSTQFIRGVRVNLRAGPSTEETVLWVLSRGTPVFPKTNEGEWVLVRVSGGPSGWIHRSLIGGLDSSGLAAPAAPRP